MKKTIPSVVLGLLGSASLSHGASTYVGGTATAADPAIYFIDSTVYLSVVYNENAGSIRLDGAEGFQTPGSGLYTGFLQEHIVVFGPVGGFPGDSVELAFFSDAGLTSPVGFTGSFDVFDVDFFSGPSGNDQATISFGSGAADQVLNTVSSEVDDDDLAAQNANAQSVSAVAESTITVVATGGSGGFVLEFSNATGVPEPSTAALGFVGGLALLRRRRK